VSKFRRPERGEEKQAATDADSPAQVRRTGMDLLARREHSALELTRKLEVRGYPQELIEEAVRGLRLDGLLSDERFAEAFVAARARRGQGPVRIRMELGARGVEEALIDQALRGAADWAAEAAAARRKRFGSGPPADYRDRAKQARFLQYRGFDSEHIQLALKAED